MKQFLCLLAIVPFIFLSCEKEDADYRDEYVGTYAINAVGSITFISIGMSIPMDMNADIEVKKHGDKQLKLTLEGEDMFVTVDEKGNFTIPEESITQTQKPEPGISITMSLTGLGTGSITDKTLYMKESYSGNAILAGEEGMLHSDVEGAVVYNGKKK